MEPGRAHHLNYALLGQEVRRVSRGDTYLSPDAQRMTRIPRAHPEGYLEAFANLYSEIAVHLLARIDGGARSACLAPGVEEGVRGVSFVEASIESSANGSTWVIL